MAIIQEPHMCEIHRTKKLDVIILEVKLATWLLHRSEMLADIVGQYRVTTIQNSAKKTRGANTLLLR